MEQTINLLPWREQRQQACRRFWGQLLAYAVGLMALITLVFQVKAGQDKQVATLWLQSDAQMLSALKAKQPHFQAQHLSWLKQQARMQRHNQTRQWQQRLAELAEKMPDSAWLTEMHFQQGQLSVSGIARTFQSLSELEKALDTTAGFRLRQTGSTGRDAQGRWQFHYQLNKEDEHAAQP